MTIQECYTQAGGNYREAAERIGSDSRLQKYLGKFLADRNYQSFLTALAQENWKEAFFCVHNLKGLCANLSLNQTAAAAGFLCEALRHGKPCEDITHMLRDFTQSYLQTMTAVKSFFEHSQSVCM